MLPFAENKSRFKYRKGQSDTIKMITDGGRGTYLANLPGGYGKTLTAIGAYFELREAREVNRFLYIAPTSAKLFEFKHDIKKQCEKIGMDVLSKSGDSAITVNDAFAIQEHRYNTHEFFMVTPHFGINKRGNILDTLLSSGDWFVCVDESHHYTEQNKFGELVEGLNARYILGLSATPDNTTQLAIFSKLPESHIHRVSIQQAIEEKAIRPISYIAGDYFLDLEIDGIPTRMTTQELQEEMDKDKIKDLNAFEIKRQLRYLGKYINPLFLKAIDKYDELIDRDTMDYIENFRKMPDRPIHQILVFADSVNIARNYVQMINQISQRPNFADWIGTGLDGRSVQENNEVLAKYKDGKLPCLVQVSIAGEGFDNPQSSIIVYLSLQYNGNQVVQKIMRGMRRNYMIEDAEKDRGLVIVPTDSKAISTIDALCKLTWEFTPEYKEKDNTEKATKEDDGLQLPLFDMEKFNRIEDVNIKDWLLSVLPEKTIQEYKQAISEMPEMKKHGIVYDDNDPVLNKVFTNSLTQLMEGKFMAVEKEMTRKNLQDAITRTIGTIARKVALYNHKNAVQGAIIGDYIKAIHGRYKFENKVATKDMTYEQLKHKIEWLNQLSNSINQSQHLPIWLQM